MMGEEEGDSRGRKQSLLEKYDIPIEHLDYAYIEKCKNVKELERIVRILRSEEEGLFPHLTEFAENHLQKFKPNSKVLRHAEPVLTKAMLDKSEWNKLSEDMEAWTADMKNLEDKFKCDCSEAVDEPALPSIRRVNIEKKTKEKEKTGNKSQRISSFDYAAWDKYDADKELLKMELEEEQRKEEVERNNKHKEKKEKLQKKKKLDEMQEIIEATRHYSQAEKEVCANRERERGNEYFRTQDYEEAIRYYTRSITILPTPAAYNNRAQTNLKLKKYGSALLDCNQVLRSEPNNVKALLRRAMAYEYKSEFTKALADFQRVLELDPNNATAQNAIRELQKRCNIKEEGMKTKRLIIEDTDSDQIEKDMSELKIDDKIQHKTESEVLEHDIEPSSDVRTKENENPESRISKEEKRIPSAEHELNDRTENTSQGSKQGSLLFKKDSDKTITIANKYNKRTAKEVHKNDNSEDEFVKPYGRPFTYQCKNRISECQLKNAEALDSKPHAGSGKMKERHKVKIEVERESDEDEAQETKVSSSKTGSGFPQQCTTKQVDHSTRQPNKENVVSVVELSKKGGGDSVILSKEAEDAKIENFNIQTPFEFIQAWQALRNNTGLEQHAQLLRSLDPSKFVALLGNKLDDPMLVTMLNCMENHFHTKDDLEHALALLTSLTKASRFNIASLFLSYSEKEALMQFFSKIEAQGFLQVASLKELYKL